MFAMLWSVFALLRLARALQSPSEKSLELTKT